MSSEPMETTTIEWVIQRRNYAQWDDMRHYLFHNEGLARSEWKKVQENEARLGYNPPLQYRLIKRTTEVVDA